MNISHSPIVGDASRVAMALTPRIDTKETSNPASNDATSTAGTDDNAMITANDFLTLLVSELKNQDPTQPTDPTTYIQQLVGVNSLQQLISINEGVTKFENAILG